MDRDSSGNWIIRGGSRSDSVHVSQSSLNGDQYLRVAFNQDTYWVPMTGAQAAKTLAIYAGAGNDSVVVDPNVTFPLFIDGGEGDDFLQGGSGPNALLGGCGNDTLVGGTSDDLFLRGPGQDTVVSRGGRDMYSLSDLYERLLQGKCGLQPAPPAAPCSPATPSTAPILAPPPPPAAPPAQQPLKLPPLRRPLPERARVQPQPSRPRLTDLLANVETHNENGFKSGRPMTKSLLSALYESPQKFHEDLASIQNAKEKDDAVASFSRALLEAGPDGGRLLREIPADDKKIMAQYLSTGNSWSANKKGIMVLLSQMTGVTNCNFGSDPSALEYVRRYQGAMS